MIVDILICTLNNGLYNIGSVLLPYNKSIRYKISHQISDSKIYPMPKELRRHDVEVCQLYGVGLSLNRNNSLSMATGDICIVADDDVRYCIDDIEKVIKIFTEKENIDVFVGKIRTYEEEPQYKNYGARIKHISWLDIGSISSIEIAFRKKSVINKRIHFDKNFGLGGTLYPKGEEAIFLSDCLKENLKIVYFPIYLVQHHYMSSGKSFKYDQGEAEYWGALSYRIFGVLASFVMLVIMIKHYRLYYRSISIRQYIHNFKKGIKKMKSSYNE